MAGRGRPGVSCQAAFCTAFCTLTGIAWGLAVMPELIASHRLTDISQRASRRMESIWSGVWGAPWAWNSSRTRTANAPARQGWAAAPSTAGWGCARVTRGELVAAPRLPADLGPIPNVPLAALPADAAGGGGGGALVAPLVAATGLAGRGAPLLFALAMLPAAPLLGATLAAPLPGTTRWARTCWSPPCTRCSPPPDAATGAGCDVPAALPVAATGAARTCLALPCTRAVTWCCTDGSAGSAAALWCTSALG